VNRYTRRFLHTALGFCALTAFVGASYPRIVAWSGVSNAHLIATTRAASCSVVGNLSPSQLVTNEQGVPLPPGQYVCDWAGNTAQIVKGGYAGWFKSGQPEQISDILKGRGFKQPQ
jgi:hypothetical protein